MGGSTALNYASANNTAFASAWVLPANSYASTKNITYYPYMLFDFTHAAFLPTKANPPTSASLTLYSIGGTMPYYNVSVYPVQPGALDGWQDVSLSFASLQGGAPATFYTYNQAGYSWPYSPGIGGNSTCTLMKGLPSTVTACTPINTTTVAGGISGFVTIDVTGYITALVAAGGVTSVDFSIVVSC